MLLHKEVLKKLIYKKKKKKKKKSADDKKYAKLPSMQKVNDANSN